MKLSVEVVVQTDAATLLEYLSSPEYLADAVARAEAVSDAQLEEREGDTVAVRWFAPTKLPRILKKYEGKAPKSVNWLERVTWDTTTYTGALQVVPDVPDSWHDKYTSSGTVTIRPTAGGVTLRQDLEFSMDFGLVGKALETLLKGEVEKLLTDRLQVLKQHFA